MKYRNFLVLVLFFLLSSCSVVQEKHGISKLSFKESLKRSLQSIPPSADVIFVSTNWDTLSYIQVDSIRSSEDYTLDEYVNAENVVEAFVIRKANRRDLRRRKKRMRALDKQAASVASKSETSSSTEVPSMDINCNRLDSLLDVIYDKDQGMNMRKDASDIDDSIEQVNQHYVINIIEKCNFPEGINFSKHGALTIWLVIQHGSKEQREKYFEKFKRAKELGLITGGNLATMEDRMLLDKNLPQKYGTQLSVTLGIYESYRLRSKDSVDIYRKSVGLEPLSEYLEKRNN